MLSATDKCYVAIERLYLLWSDDWGTITTPDSEHTTFFDASARTCHKIIFYQ